MDILTAKKKLEELTLELGKAIIGQQTVIEKIIVALERCKSEYEKIDG